MAKSPDIGDIKFVASLNEGSPSSFTELFNHYNLRLSSYAYRILNNDNDAKEIVHITFCKLWDKRDNLEIKESLEAYLYRSVYNNCISLLRKKKQYSMFVDQEAADVYFNRIIQNPHAELKLIDSEYRKYIVSAINELPEKCREIFYKCKIEGKTYPEVAQTLDISVKTVEAQMTTALKRLRKKLDWLLILLIH
ncbi:MAG: RNA polymerase sigma-70 factor [Bacteroidales bacterium]|nr:RNA polymerase sigma-70 factor [Bacteroidales bacterium]